MNWNNMNKIKCKLKDNHGFTLTEMLTVLLVMGLLFSFVGGGVVVVKTAYDNITLQAEAQTLASTTLTAVMDDLRFAVEIQGDGTSGNIEDVEFDSLSRNYRMSFVNHSDDGICVQPNKMNSVDDSKMAAIPVVTGETMTNRLYTKMTALTYQNNPDYGTDVFTVTIEVYKVGEPGTAILSKTQIVRPVNAE